MKKTALAPLIATFCLFSLCLKAADFWQTKPPAEWSQKQLQKMITDSPWAQPFTLTTSGSASGSGGKKGGGGGDQASQLDSPDIFVARWQSAAPLKQALLRLRLGAEAGTSPQAQALLDHVETTYIIVVSGPLRKYLRGNMEDLKAALISATSLAAKGKGTLKPTEVEINVSQATGIQLTGDIVFQFPRSAPYTLDDKDVELSTKLGKVPLVYKFRLKDMVFGDKLEL